MHSIKNNCTATPTIKFKRVPGDYVKLNQIFWNLKIEDREAKNPGKLKSEIKVIRNFRSREYSPVIFAPEFRNPLFLCFGFAKKILAKTILSSEIINLKLGNISETFSILWFNY